LPPMARGQKKATMPDKVKAKKATMAPVDPWNSRQSRGRMSPRSGLGVRTTLIPRLPLPLQTKEGPGHWSMLPPFRPKKSRGLGGIPSYVLTQHPGGDGRYCGVASYRTSTKKSP
jgi:hypothetical protein